MADSQKAIDGRLDLSEVKGHPVRAQLRPPLSQRPTERRDVSSRRALVRRVHREFLETPGLTLSSTRHDSFSLSSSVCARVFGELVADGCLRVTIDGCYALLNKCKRRSD